MKGKSAHLSARARVDCMLAFSHEKRRHASASRNTNESENSVAKRPVRWTPLGPFSDPESLSSRRDAHLENKHAFRYRHPSLLAPWGQQGPLGVNQKIDFGKAISAGRFLDSFGELPGDPQERKVRDVSCETHGFESGRK